LDSNVLEEVPERGPRPAEPCKTIDSLEELRDALGGGIRIMTETLALLFYFAVFAGLVGAVGYLFVTRAKSHEAQLPAATPVSRDSLQKAEDLSGTYRLADLESLFGELAAREAWGVFAEIGFTTIHGSVSLAFNQDYVEVVPNSADMDCVARSVARHGLETVSEENEISAFFESPARRSESQPRWSKSWERSTLLERARWLR
jgi:hypothetical protein